jgi:superfamily II DNA/RNA helicase
MYSTYSDRKARFEPSRRSFNKFPRYGGRGGGGGGGRGRFSQGNTIHESKFVRKADKIAQPEPFTPRFSFTDLAINESIKKNIVKRGFTDPTPIQDGAINHILQGKDVIGVANTGTGKTGAFLIPLIHKISLRKGDKVLILVPTRELALQIQDELRSFSWGMGVYSTLCIGGASMRQQIYELRRNPQFVIGTPGRIKDLIDRKVIDMSFFTTFVLDEVDRMLDMGFVKEIKYLISLLPEKRQSLFFSATLSGEINTLIKSFMVEPVTVSVKSGDTSVNVDQDVVRVGMNSKPSVLQALLKKEEMKKVLIFGRTKMGVERLSNDLFKQGFKVASIHGDKPQFKRQTAIRLFKENAVSILVATDVAARGLDIADITHVINYDQPATYEDYVHRIGRTGRGNKKGFALTFV